jgi:hypothetical protein
VTTLYVVEPHADDAYLSLGWLIASTIADGGTVAIITVYSGTRRRAADAQRYADAVGASWVGLGLVESDVGLARDAPTPPPPIRRADLPVDGRLVLPLGVRHPEHRSIASIAESGDGLYLDTPYQLRAANQAEVATKLLGRSIEHWSLPPWRRKYVHHALFKDQSLFMHRNPPADLAGAIELIVRHQ